MKTLNITVPKVHCERKTDFLGKDEVYFALVVTTGKMSDFNDPTAHPKVVFAQVSPLNTKFGKGTIKPLDLGGVWQADLGDAEAFGISFGLYEKDSGDIYELIQSKLPELPHAPNVDMKKIWEEVVKNVKDKLGNFSFIGLLESLISVGTTVFNEIRKDDLIGYITFSSAVDDPGIRFPREYQLRGGGAIYNLQLSLTNIE